MLRTYQKKAVDDIERYYSIGTKKLLLHMPTGSGKTHIFSHLLKKTKLNSLMVVKGRKLVKQAHKRLLRENVEHTVLMANFEHETAGSKIKIASIDTIHRRRLAPRADFIVVDEADEATSVSYVRLLNMPEYKNAFVLGVTATPYCGKSLTHLANKIVRPVSYLDLVESKFLVSLSHRCPTMPDLSGIKIVNGDFENYKLFVRCNRKEIIGSIPYHWKKYAYRQPTICFAVNIEHSKNIVKELNAQDVRAVHVDSRTKDFVRERELKRLENGEIDVISNVGILCRGVDIPFLKCIIMARPTESYRLYLQQLGRGTRPFEDKKSCLILDHAGNTLRHGFMDFEPEATLDGKAVFTHSIKKITICNFCYAAFIGRKCPQCGELNKVKERPPAINQKPGELREPDPEIMTFIRTVEMRRRHKGYAKEWVYAQVCRQFGKDIANIYYPIKKKLRFRNQISLYNRNL